MHNRLPHDILGADPVHLTYRLAGSIPRVRVEKIVAWRRHQLDALHAKLIGLPTAVRISVECDARNAINASYGVRLDRALHKAQGGPFHLQNLQIARIVLDSWAHLSENGDVVPYAICVMGNHVHAVIRAHPALAEEADLSRIMCRHKSHTGRMANRLLGRTGSPFWEVDYFDRRIRKGEFMRVMWYVLRNPVAAGLVADWQDWPHTFVHPELVEMFTGEPRLGSSVLKGDNSLQ